MHSPDRDTVACYEAAAAWFTRRRAGEAMSGQDEAAFQAWLMADPRHRQAYEEVAQTWSDFDAVPRPALASDVSRGTPPMARALGRPPVRARRAWVMAGVAACLAAVATGVYVHVSAPVFREALSTAHAEQRAVTLPDQSVVSLNADTALDVRFTSSQREVRLARGEAFFQVSRRADQPFVVKADGVDVRVLGTAFNVRLGEHAVYVKVREGTVRVDTAGRTTSAVATLTAGQAVAIDRGTGAVQPLSSAPEVAGSWRVGQLVFRHATLAEVVDELGGYLNRPIQLVGRDTAALRLSGFASTAQPDQFLDALPALLPVKVVRLAGGGYRISAVSAP